MIPSYYHLKLETIMMRVYEKQLRNQFVKLLNCRNQHHSRQGHLVRSGSSNSKTTHQPSIIPPKTDLHLTVVGDEQPSRGMPG